MTITITKSTGNFTFGDPESFLYMTNDAILPSVATATFRLPYMVVELKVLLNPILVVKYKVFRDNL